MKSNKQGSALLIVLGFLSFMVASAVAFAVYMRAERMPSSALRRAVATRHLVKAALAEAISRVDDAVRDDPFPGFCPTNTYGAVTDSTKFYYFQWSDAAATQEAKPQAIDSWDGRVFMPPAQDGGTVDGHSRYAPVTETVSPLTLEGLGYLPPPLVNDVRFLSRSSWAASWQPLLFDSGRFAYCAVNVSDYLDINRIPANQPRTSEPARRLSLAPLFDKDFDLYDTFEESSYKGRSIENPDTSAAKKFDDFTGKTNFRSGYAPGENVSGQYESWDAIGEKAPYVSMMDYNLALAATGPSSFLTPLFYNWLADKRRDQSYYIDSRGNRNSEMYAALRQPFVTDSWAYETKKWAELPDYTAPQDILTDGGHPFYDQLQYFTGVNWSPQRNYYNAAVNITQGGAIPDKMEKAGYHSGIHALLWDYLDHDDFPLSLALPCVERVPMVAGISTPSGFVAPVMNPVGGNGTTSKTWSFDPSKWFQGSAPLDVLVAFPFKYGKRDQWLKCSVQLLVKVAFVQDGVLATSDADLRKMILPTLNDWAMQPGTSTMPDQSRLLFTFMTDRESLQSLQTRTIKTEANAVELITTINLAGACSKMISQPIQILEYTDPGKQSGQQGAQPLDYYTISVSPFTAKGAAVGGNLPATVLSAAFNTSVKPLLFRPHLFVWARIVDDASGKTVDLAPAGIADDVMVNGMGAQSGQEIEQDLGQFIAGGQADAQRPIFEFVDTNYALSYDQIVNGTVSGNTQNWNPGAIYAVDPRFNNRPEHWYQTTSAKFSAQDWLSETHTAMKARTVAYLGQPSQYDRPDPDIFMFTSNMGVLQSLGEFGFLPNLATKKVPAQVDLNGSASVGTSATAVMTSYPYLWHTYDPRDVIVDLTTRNIAGHSKQGESLVNPHTDNLGIMMTALANTPVDYWAAARNVDSSTGSKIADVFKRWGNQQEMKNPSFSSAQQYMFSANNNLGAKLEYDELVDAAKNLMFLMGGLSVDPTRHTAIKDLANVIADRKSFVGSGTSEESVLDAFDAYLSKKDAHDQILLYEKNQIRGGVSPSLVWQKIWDYVCKPLMIDVEDPENPDDPSQKDFMGTSLGSPLHSVDRKFLYSYWRDCFANNQQLYLIFVRAESSALGGPGEGTPSQQGGRAVALVWRDPDWSEADGKDRDTEVRNDGNVNRQRPHRTRVLFYHQFD